MRQAWDDNTGKTRHERNLDAWVDAGQ